MLNMEDLYRLLRTGHVQAQGIVDTIDEPLLVLDASLCVQNASRAFFETFKVERYETIGQPIYELGNGQWDIPELRLLLEKVLPKATAIINYEVEHEFPGLGHRTMLVTARTLNHPDRTSHSMLVSLVDVTGGRAADAAKDILFGELRHRMKNVLGVAQSIARQMPTEGRSAEDFRDAFLARFDALMDAQDLAFSEQDDLGLRGLIERILAPYTEEAGNVAMEGGPELTLAPRILMSLGMVLHEMATNAVKYGSLGVAGGQVAIGWELAEGSRELKFRWRESGGPHVTPPTTTSYGTRLISSTVSYSLNGTVEQDYAEGGLQAVIIIPLGRVDLTS